MDVDKPIKLRWLLVSVALLLTGMAVVIVDGYGEVLQEIPGQVQRCEYLGGGEIMHATIKTEVGRYVITPLPNCLTDSQVTVFVKRSVFYFNTVYTAEMH